MRSFERKNKMKNPLLTFLLFFIAGYNLSGQTNTSQELNDSLALYTSFYNTTLKSSFSDSIIHPDQKKFNNILIKSVIDPKGLITEVGENKLHYVINIRSELKRPYKRNKGRAYHIIRHKRISPDTIDVNISIHRINGYEWDKVQGIKVKVLKLGMECGGTMGYIPNGRFIFDKNINDWKFVSYREIWLMKEEEDKKYWKEIQTK